MDKYQVVIELHTSSKKVFQQKYHDAFEAVANLAKESRLA
jgi:hypothetical protein